MNRTGNDRNAKPFFPSIGRLEGMKDEESHHVSEEGPKRFVTLTLGQLLRGYSAGILIWGRKHRWSAYVGLPSKNQQRKSVNAGAAPEKRPEKRREHLN